MTLKLLSIFIYYRDVIRLFLNIQLHAQILQF